MSMHQYMPDQAVLADSWTLFCPECAQKMRIIMAAPAQDGKETRTYECVYGHRERITVAFIDPKAASIDNRLQLDRLSSRIVIQ